jgi:hypothetical protein
MRKDTLLLLVLWIFMVTLLQLRPIDDVDIFWQMRAGQIMLDQSKLITKDPFTYTHVGESVPTIGWLAQIIFAWVHRVGSWPWVKVLHDLIFSGAFVIAAGSAVRYYYHSKGQISLISMACAMLLGFLTCFTNSSLRPQSFALFCFAVLLAVTQCKWRFRTKLLVLIPLLVFWQNCHPSVVIGLVALAGWGVSEWFDPAKRRKAISILMLVALAQLGTPMGWKVFEVSQANVEISRDYLGVSEWLSPWSSVTLRPMLMFWLGLAVSLFLVMKLRLKVRRNDLLNFVLMTLLTFYASRFALFWAIAMVPVWARWIEGVRPPHLFNWWTGGDPVQRPAWAVLLILVLLIVLATPALPTSTVLHPGLPLEGMTRLKTALPSGRIYNYRQWGGPLIWTGYPQWQVAIDGRLYLYSEKEWEGYNKAALGKVPLRELVEEHKPDAFFLRPSFHQKLMTLLKQSPAWRELYTDNKCSIFLKMPSSEDHMADRQAVVTSEKDYPLNLVTLKKRLFWTSDRV